MCRDGGGWARGGEGMVGESGTDQKVVKSFKAVGREELAVVGEVGGVRAKGELKVIVVGGGGAQGRNEPERIATKGWESGTCIRG